MCKTFECFLFVLRNVIFVNNNEYCWLTFITHKTWCLQHFSRSCFDLKKVQHNMRICILFLIKWKVNQSNSDNGSFCKCKGKICQLTYPRRGSLRTQNTSGVRSSDINRRAPSAGGPPSCRWAGGPCPRGSAPKSPPRTSRGMSAGLAGHRTSIGL